MPMPVKSHSAPQMRSRLLQQLLDMGFRVSHQDQLSLSVRLLSQQNLFVTVSVLCSL